MANEWQQTQLGKVCLKIGSGATPRGGKEAYRGGDTALIRSQNIYNDRFTREGLAYINDSQAHELRSVVVQKNDVLLNITGDSVARCCLVVPEVLPARVNQHVAIIRTQPDVLDARFLRYVLVSPSMQDHLLALASAGATRNALTKAMIESLSIKAPRIDEQRAIAHILGTLDDKIELNRRSNETLESMARALFKAWFVDFEPVRAKIAGRWQRGQSLPSLPKQLYDIFPGQLIESEFGEIPEGWVPDQLATFTSIKNGYAFKSKDWRDCGVPVVKIGSVKPRFVDLRQASFIEDSLAQEKSQFRLNAGDMLVGLTGYVGETGRVPVVDVFPMLNQRVGKFEPKEEFAPFIFASVRAAEFKAFAESKAHGSAQPNVSTADLLTYPVINPGKDILAEFCNITGPIFDQQLRCESESRSIAQLRDTLLPKLISGELRVSDVEKIVGAMA